jgi:hypothetical protein
MGKERKIRCENIRYIEWWTILVAVQLHYIGFI